MSTRNVQFFNPETHDLEGVVPPDAVLSICDNPKFETMAMLVDNDCVAAGGLRIVHERSAEAFLFLKGAIPGFAHIYLRHYFQRMCMKYHRVQALVNINAPKAIRYVQWLGMRPECVMVAAGPRGEDYLVFVIIQGVNR